MRTILVDTSGGMPAEALSQIQEFLRVGDRVVMFDTDPIDRGVMNSQADIDTLQWEGGSGTMLTKTLTLLGNTQPSGPITIFTDGYIWESLDELRQLKARYQLIFEDVRDPTNKYSDVTRNLREALL